MTGFSQSSFLHFEVVIYREFCLPSIPPTRDTETEMDFMHKVSHKMREDIGVRIFLCLFGIFRRPKVSASPQTFLGAARPLLLDSDLSEDIVSQAECNALQESNKARIPQYTRLQYVYARKKAS